MRPWAKESESASEGGGERTAAREDQGSVRGEEAREAQAGTKGSNLPGATFPDFQGDAGVEFLINDLGRDKVAFARDGFVERAQNSQCLSMGRP